MRIGLIGNSYHWRYYEQILAALPEARIVAVAPGCAAETLDGFVLAPGVTAETARYEDARQMLDEARLDVVQVATAFEAIAPWIIAAAERGIAVLAEKPVACDLASLARLAEAARRHALRLHALQGMMDEPAFIAAREAVRAGLIGEAYASYHQKSYMWADRPETWKRRATFPGLVPWVGIHALAWMHWMLGDVFVEVAGWEGGALHPETPACATQAGLVFRQRNGGYALLSIDYLRPRAAPTHGDERARVAGSEGVVEASFVDKRAVLVTRDQPPRDLPLAPPANRALVRFARSLRGEDAPPMTTRDALRVTEIALSAQQAAESGKPLSLATTMGL